MKLPISMVFLKIITLQSNDDLSVAAFVNVFVLLLDKIVEEGYILNILVVFFKEFKRLQPIFIKELNGLLLTKISIVL